MHIGSQKPVLQRVLIIQERVHTSWESISITHYGIPSKELTMDSTRSHTLRHSLARDRIQTSRELSHTNLPLLARSSSIPPPKNSSIPCSDFFEGSDAKAGTILVLDVG